MNFLEITAEQIAKLNDTDLRILIGLLCEEDYRLAGLSTKGITWGGHQKAKDGGIDVSVECEDEPPQNSFLTRKLTGLQVKSSDLTPKQIKKEMYPKGALRKAIYKLVQNKGSYIIVSSGSSPSYEALSERLKAMRDAVSEEKELHIDFFDKNRIASWVRNHTGLTIWVHNKIGYGSSGWRAYDNWANPIAGIKEEYILDDELRLTSDIFDSKEKRSFIESIAQLRMKLGTAGSIVRLIGFSGIGKTRFVQALFDERVGEKSLCQSLALYTDLADSPAPDPKTLAQSLVAEKRKGILVIDNCSLELHNKLTDICCNTSVSLLTIEYDIRDDYPENTSLIRLEPASERLIEKLIIKRFENISSIDARTIAKFSGGNARIALALANTVEKFGTLSGLKNDELFKRLFQQRHNENHDLLKSAEVCSLVYSIELSELENSDLNLLASLVNKEGSDLYYYLSEMEQRGLVQSRGKYKAILPLAIANWLAKRALKKIPKDRLENLFLNKGSKRFLKSFVHRLNALHDSEEAIAIVSEWLSENGWMSIAIENEEDFDLRILKNVAPVSPEKTLQAIERISNLDSMKFLKKEKLYAFSQILKSIAFDSQYFARCAQAIFKFSLTEKTSTEKNTIRGLLKSFFFIQFSGTHAPLEMRTEFILKLINSNKIQYQEMGLYLLESALSVPYFPPITEFDFGAWPRDPGYQPTSQDEVVNWYGSFINICTKMIIDQPNLTIQAKQALANNFYALSRTQAFDILEESVKNITQLGSWSEGWLSVLDVIADFGISENLLRLDNLLRPKSFTERIKAYLSSIKYIPIDPSMALNINENSAVRKMPESIIQEMAVKISNDIDALKEIFPDIFSLTSIKSHYFGKGLAEGSYNLKNLWKILYNQFIKIPDEKRSVELLLGYLFVCRNKDAELCEILLDQALSDEHLSKYFPQLQIIVSVDKRGINRLHQSLDSNKCDINMFRFLISNEKSPEDNALANLLNKILLKENGLDLVLETLTLRFSQFERKYIDSSSLIELARKVLLSFSFRKEKERNNYYNYDLVAIVEVCLIGNGGKDFADKISKKLINLILNKSINAHDYNNFLKILAELQPTSYLENFIRKDLITNHLFLRIYLDRFDLDENPLDKITDEVIISWCDNMPIERYSIAITVLNLFEKNLKNKKLEWKTIFYYLLKKSPDLEVLLSQISEKLIPNYWSGSSFAFFLKERQALLSELLNHENVIVKSWAKTQYDIISEKIEGALNYKNKFDFAFNDSFE